MALMRKMSRNTWRESRNKIHSDFPGTTVSVLQNFLQDTPSVKSSFFRYSYLPSFLSQPTFTISRQEPDNIIRR